LACLVKVVPVLAVYPTTMVRHEGFSKRYRHEVLEQSRHVDQEAVQQYTPGVMLNGGGVQHDLGEPQGYVVAGIEPGWLPRRDRVPRGRDATSLKSRSRRRSMRCDSASTRGTVSIRSQAVCRI